MKLLARFTLILTSIVILSSTCFAQDGGRTFEPPPPPAQAAEYVPNRWTTFSEIPGFAITMPGEPTASTQQIDSADGKLTLRLYRLTTSTGSYLVSYFDLPLTLNDPYAIKNALDSGRDNMLAKNTGMKLLKEQEINIAGYVGKELLIENEDTFWRQRGFIVGRRLYQIVLLVPHRVAFGLKRPSADPSDFTDFYQMIATKFLDSVRFYNSGSGSAFKLDEELKNAVRGGVLNGKATSLPKPSYPREAMEAGASGTVTVHILIDEEGKVMWAKAVSGHRLLQEAASQAALKARFAPFKLKGQPAKVTGVLTYNFVR